MKIISDQNCDEHDLYVAKLYKTVFFG